MYIKRYLLQFAILHSILAGSASVNAAVYNSVSISNNSGGVIARFVLKAAEYRDAGTLIRFVGRCDSACTLYLSLPSEQMCVGPNSYFRFHAPAARSARSVKFAQSFMMRQYPPWVRSWIQGQGGLSRKLITMDYAHASQFLPTC